MGIFTKGINPAAFSGTLECPHPHPKDFNRRCGANKWKLVGWVTPTRVRYRCKQCGKGVQYEISAQQFNSKQLRPIR